jgi:hypothetical protein
MRTPLYHARKYVRKYVLDVMCVSVTDSCELGLCTIQSWQNLTVRQTFQQLVAYIMNF